MEHINATLLSLDSLASPWLAAKNATLSSSRESITNQPQGIPLALLIEMVFFISMMAIQAVLLHPIFQHSSSARLTRYSLGPLIIGWWLCYPFRLPVTPFENRSAFPGFLAILMIFKSTEWTFASGPYCTRTLKTVDGVPMWEKESADKISLKENKSDFADLALWTALLFSAQRGFRWSWAPAAKGNQNSFLQAILELIRLQLVMLLCFGFVLYTQDLTTYDFDSRRLFLDLGVPSFRGLHVIASAVHSTCTMFLISSTLEMMHGIPVLFTYVLYPLVKKLGLPSKLSELINPSNFPAQFGSMFELYSLAHFWSKTWHQKFRRPFLFCGGKPAMYLARVLGGSSNVQKAFGVMGVFVVSGLLHEYPMYAYQRAPHPYPRELFKTLPASFIFFFVQSFGLILEPFIIPHIPKRIGGGKLWTAMFLFLTAPIFTRDICRPNGMFNQYRIPEQFTWLQLYIPAPIASRVLSQK